MGSVQYNQAAVHFSLTDEGMSIKINNWMGTLEEIYRNKETFFKIFSA